MAVIIPFEQLNYAQQLLKPTKINILVLNKLKLISNIFS